MTNAASTERLPNFRFADLRRGVPRLVWLVLVLQGLVFASYAILIPYYRSPDEIQHVDMIVHLQRSLDYPQPQQRQMSLGVMNSTVAAGYGRVPTRSASENRALGAKGVTPRADRPTFDQLGGDQPYILGNQMGQHPPVYYGVAAAALRVVPGSGGWPWDRVVHYLRLLSVLMLLPIALLSYATARRLGGSEHAGIAASAVTLAIPQFANIGSSVNNDNLLVLLTGFVTLLLAYVATGDSSRRTALLVAGAGTLALLTKGLVLFLPIWIAIVYGVAAWRAVDSRLARRGVLAVALTSVLGGAWWLRNVVVYGAVQPRGLIGPPLPGSPAEPFSLGDKGADWAQRAMSLLSSRFWVEHSMTKTCTGPPLAAKCPANPDAQWISAWTTVATVTLVALAIVAFIAAGRRTTSIAAVRRRAGLLPLVAVALPFAFAFVQVVVVDWLEYAHSGALSGLQGRYFFLALVGIAALVSIGGAAALGRHERWLPLLLLLAAVVLHARTISTVLGNHWSGAGPDVGATLDAATAWSALPALLVRTTWLAAVLMTCAVGVLFAVGAMGEQKQTAGDRTVSG